MPFAPGQSGNPLGKPKGSGDKRLEIRRMLEAKGPEIVQKLLDMALYDNDPTAMKLIMERIAPKPKSDSVNLGIQVNQMLSGGLDLKGIITEVMKEVLNGNVPDDQSRSIASLIKSASEVEQNIELAKKVDEIEKRLGISNGV